ncbi:tetratricopeptide repeat protein [Cupriavidus sp. IDO]|uniref:tetratricopeptide repeat protein n=1 Tax=Cupriavidus sp. IDO TaxID=1539142 RepID=UPI001269F3A9|nr:hypothetical protein [Cupriavidus sp. IDO]
MSIQNKTDTLEKAGHESKSAAADSPSSATAAMRGPAWPRTSNGDTFWVRFFSHWLPLYTIVGSICFIAVANLWPLGARRAEDKVTISQAAAQAVPSMPAGAPASAAQVMPRQLNAGTSQTTSPAVPSAQSANSSSEVKVTDVAKMAIDVTKERVDMMKESYDRQFSLLAALGALLAFFGFKGIESFFAARAKAQETLEKAQNAVQQAEEAKREADEAKREAQETVQALHNFVKTRYARDNNAEVNVAHGIVLREIAEVYKEVMSPEKLGPVERTQFDANHKFYLQESKKYLLKVTEMEREDDMDQKVISKAYGHLAMVYKRLADPERALEAVQKAVRANDADYSAHYNMACYHCLVGERSSGDAREEHYAAALKSLETAISMNRKFARQAKADPDLKSLEADPHFEKLIAR